MVLVPRLCQCCRASSSAGLLSAAPRAARARAPWCRAARSACAGARGTTPHASRRRRARVAAPQPPPHLPARFNSIYVCLVYYEFPMRMEKQTHSITSQNRAQTLRRYLSILPSTWQNLGHLVKAAHPAFSMPQLLILSHVWAHLGIGPCKAPSRPLRSCVQPLYPSLC